MFKINRSALVGTALVAASSMASAAVDVTAVTGAGTDIAAVGVAVFAVMVGIKLTKWIRRAL